MPALMSPSCAADLLASMLAVPAPTIHTLTLGRTLQHTMDMRLWVGDIQPSDVTGQMFLGVTSHATPRQGVSRLHSCRRHACPSVIWVQQCHHGAPEAVSGFMQAQTCPCWLHALPGRGTSRGRARA